MQAFDKQGMSVLMACVFLSEIKGNPCLCGSRSGLSLGINRMGAHVSIGRSDFYARIGQKKATIGACHS